MSLLRENSAWQLVEMQRRGETTATALLDESIARIEKHNPTLNAIITTCFDRAREAAEVADRCLADTGKLIGPLHGLPTAVKDLFCTADVRTTFGNQHFADHVPAHDDPVVARERAAGAVIVGKTNLPDCACGGITSNELFGLTRNPWNHERTTSGSGGGAVSALASGMISYADGSDVGGSVRSPAGFTNLVGFRPSSGRVPGLAGTGADGDTSTPGVFTRCVKDVALFMQACDGPLAASPSRYPQGERPEVAALEADVCGLRVTFEAAISRVPMDPEFEEMFAREQKQFTAAGCIRADRPVDFSAAYSAIFPHFNRLAQIRGLPAEVVQDYRLQRPMSASVRSLFEGLEGVSGLDIARLLTARDRLAEHVDAWFEHTDAVVSLMHAAPAFAAGDRDGEESFPWGDVWFAPLLGLPSICVPMGFAADGMPCGITVTGRRGSDMNVLRIAHAYEQVTGYGRQLPNL